MKNTNRNVCAAALIVSFALTAANALLFRYGFQKWIVPLYALSVVVFGGLAFTLNLLLFKAEDKTKPTLLANYINHPTPGMHGLFVDVLMPTLTALCEARFAEETAG